MSQAIGNQLAFIGMDLKSRGRGDVLAPEKSINWQLREFVGGAEVSQ